MVAAGGVYAARAFEGVFPAVLAWLGIAIAVTSASAFHLRLVPEASQEVRRHSVIRDPNRMRRVTGLLAAGAIIVLAAALG